MSAMQMAGEMYLSDPRSALDHLDLGNVIGPGLIAKHP